MPQALVIVVPQLWPSRERLQARVSRNDDESQLPAEHAKLVQVRDWVPVSSQKPVKPPQLPQPPQPSVPQLTPSVSREQARVSIRGAV